MPKGTKRTSPGARTATHITKAKIPPSFLSDLSLFRRFVDRSGGVITPTKVEFTPTITRVDSFRIATISTTLLVNDLQSEWRCGKKYHLSAIKLESRRKALQEEYLSLLLTAAQAGAQFACFNELSYPIAGDYAQERQFQRRVQSIVRRHKLTLVGGGFHDWKGHYNICPIFSVDRTRTDWVGKELYYPHAKLTPGSRVDELVRTPADGKLRYYVSRYGVFCVMLCIDVYNPALALRLIKKNHHATEEDKVDVIFVPSFTNRAAELTNACRDLSYATATLVAYVNCGDGGTSFRHTLWLAGQELPQHDGPTGHTCTLLRDGQIALHKVSYDLYHEYRLNTTDKYSEVFEYIVNKKHTPGLEFAIRKKS